MPVQGKQMPPVLCAAGVAIAALGNHDLDYGVENFKALAAECGFPWLCANAVDLTEGELYAHVGGCLYVCVRACVFGAQACARACVCWPWQLEGGAA